VVSSTQPVSTVVAAPHLLPLLCLETAVPSWYVQYLLRLNCYH
jgi:hypothetical protein